MMPDEDRRKFPEGGTGRPLGAFLAGPFAVFGRSAIRWINNSGAAVIFFVLAFLRIFRPKQFSKIVQQVYYIGARSSMIIMLVGLFTGMVIGLQMYSALVKVGAQGYLGTIVALSLVRELGPVLAAIMITARAGSSITAEIGIQRISEQVDALTTMRIHPLRYLISPRIAAAIISFPVLTAMFDIIGIIGGYISGVLIMGANSGTYIYRVQASVEMKDHHPRFHQGGGLRRHRLHRLLFSGLFRAHAYGQSWRQGRRSRHHIGRRAFLRADSAVRLYRDLTPHLRKDPWKRH